MTCCGLKTQLGVREILTLTVAFENCTASCRLAQVSLPEITRLAVNLQSRLHVNCFKTALQHAENATRRLFEKKIIDELAIVHEILPRIYAGNCIPNFTRIARVL